MIVSAQYCDVDLEFEALGGYEFGARAEEPSKVGACKSATL